MIEKKFSSTLPLIDISLDVSNLSEDQQREYVGDLGRAPLVYYNGIHIQQNDIGTLKIHTFNFLPTIEMTFSDSTGMMDDNAYPLDNTIISVFIDPKSEVYEAIRLDFKITNYDILKRRGKGSDLTLKGVLNCDYLFIQKNIAYKDLTSYQAMEKIAKESGLGFASNMSSTNDKMTWINPNMQGDEFIKSIAQRAYVSDDGFIWTYIDIYRNLHFINVEAAIEGEVKEDNVLNEHYKTEKRETDNQKLVLTNDESMKNNNTFISAMQILNRSTEMSIESGYRKRVHMYDTSGNWSEKAGEFLIFDLDSINTPGSENNLIVLKSSPLGENFFKENINHEYLGKLDKDNVHLDYLYATSQNTHNINNLQKIALKIILPNPNYSLARYQKVRIAISNQATPLTAAGHINARLSGEWIIIGLGYEYSNRRGGSLEQVVTLVRRELEPDKDNG